MIDNSTNLTKLLILTMVTWNNDGIIDRFYFIDRIVNTLYIMIH